MNWEWSRFGQLISLNKWNNHLKTALCLYSGYLCLSLKFVWWPEACKCVKCKRRLNEWMSTAVAQEGRQTEWRLEEDRSDVQDNQEKQEVTKLNKIILITAEATFLGKSDNQTFFCSSSSLIFNVEPCSASVHRNWSITGHFSHVPVKSAYWKSRARLTTIFFKSCVSDHR